MKEILKKAFEDMETAAALRKEADRLDYQAKKQLADVYQGGILKEESSSANIAVQKRLTRIFKSQA